MPYGFGVYLSNITRAQLEKSFPPEAINELFPASQVICKDELSEFMTKEQISARLESLLRHNYAHHTTPQQLDRIRWHLYPDVRINASVTQVDLNNFTFHTPDVVCMMDRNQNNSPEAWVQDTVLFMAWQDPVKRSFCTTIVLSLPTILKTPSRSR